jgi:hypothetical protein
MTEAEHHVEDVSNPQFSSPVASPPSYLTASIQIVFVHSIPLPLCSEVAYTTTTEVSYHQFVHWTLSCPCNHFLPTQTMLSILLAVRCTCHARSACAGSKRPPHSPGKSEYISPLAPFILLRYFNHVCKSQIAPKLHPNTVEYDSNTMQQYDSQHAQGHYSQSAYGQQPHSAGAYSHYTQPLHYGQPAPLRERAPHWPPTSAYSYSDPYGHSEPFDHGEPYEHLEHHSHRISYEHHEHHSHRISYGHPETYHQDEPHLQSEPYNQREPIIHPNAYQGSYEAPPLFRRAPVVSQQAPSPVPTPSPIEEEGDGNESGSEYLYLSSEEQVGRVSTPTQPASEPSRSTPKPSGRRRIPLRRHFGSNKFPFEPFPFNPAALYWMNRYPVNKRIPATDDQGRKHRRDPAMGFQALPFLDWDEALRPCYYVYGSRRACPYPEDNQCLANHNITRDQFLWLILERGMPVDLANKMIAMSRHHTPEDMLPSNRHLELFPPQDEITEPTPEGTMTETEIKAWCRAHRILPSFLQQKVGRAYNLGFQEGSQGVCPHHE